MDEDLWTTMNWEFLFITELGGWLSDWGEFVSDRFSDRLADCIIQIVVMLKVSGYFAMIQWLCFSSHRGQAALSFKIGVHCVKL